MSHDVYRSTGIYIAQSPIHNAQALWIPGNFVC
jgi:hypothetical protein